uniref:Uncharacterized protein n=1 Tax=Octopus bimaculoides TaxID=37653 RepID=A0A0L8H8X4_OCTBM
MLQISIQCSIKLFTLYSFSKNYLPSSLLPFFIITPYLTPLPPKKERKKKTQNLFLLLAFIKILLE